MLVPIGEERSILVILDGLEKLCSHILRQAKIEAVSLLPSLFLLKDLLQLFYSECSGQKQVDIAISSRGGLYPRL